MSKILHFSSTCLFRNQPQKRNLPVFQLLFLSLAVLLTSRAIAGLPPVVDGQPLPSLAPMLEKVMPAVVNIRTRIQSEVPPPFVPGQGERFSKVLPSAEDSLGSGVIIDASAGYVVTNQHVIEDARAITVTLHDGRSLPATVIGADPETDLAVVQIAADGLQGIAFFDSNRLRVGDFVVAVGNAFGLNQTVTSGIVSGMGRSGLGFDRVEDFIQTDAMVHPGNSGGALVNLRGELVGINTAILAPGGNISGISFAIPVSLALSVVEQLVGHGEVRRGSLGAQFQDITPELAAAYGIADSNGAVITQIASDSAAASAGLKTGDVVVAIDGQAVRDAVDLRNRIGLVRVGVPSRLSISRRQQNLDKVVQMNNPSLLQMEGDKLSTLWAGTLIGEIESGLGGFRGGKRVQVLSIEEDSRAMQLGLRAGDVIDTLNRQGVDTLSDLIKLVSQTGGRAGNMLRIRVLRGGNSLVLKLY